MGDYEQKIREALYELTGSTPDGNLAVSLAFGRILRVIQEARAEIRPHTPADYHRSDPVPTPAVLQVEGVAYCAHDHLKGNCRHKECPHYAPNKKEKTK